MWHKQDNQERQHRTDHHRRLCLVLHASTTECGSSPSPDMPADPAQNSHLLKHNRHAQ